MVTFLIIWHLFYWNFTFWWDWSEEVCTWFQAVRQLVMLLHSTTVTLLQFSQFLTGKYPKLSRLLQYMPKLVWIVSIILAYPVRYVWRLKVNIPEQMLWYYELQGIKIPKSITSKIFSTEIIAGHFQCALQGWQLNCYWNMT